MMKKDKALLVMDMQISITDRYENADSVIANIKKSIEYARRNEIAIIFVMVSFRPGMPEVSASNKVFFASKQRAGNTDMTEMMKIHPELTPMANDIVVKKYRFSAFSGSDLEILLRSMEIKQLILTGIATSGVVLSTLREASDKDFVLTVLSDACTDTDPEIHNVLTTKIFPLQAEVISTEAWIS
ncbi:MAG: isochorismatase family cysteine hydrolase [Dyadobacter sp.]